MLYGYSIRAPNGATATYFSPWFPRQGTRAVFACNVIASYEVDYFKVYVQTKKSEDDNETASIEDVTGSPETITQTPVHDFPCGIKIDGSESTQGFQDLVRYKYELKSNTSKRAWVHFRMLDPTWETD